MYVQFFYTSAYFMQFCHWFYKEKIYTDNTDVDKMPLFSPGVGWEILNNLRYRIDYFKSS